MNGFKNKCMNQRVYYKMLEDIVVKIMECCEMMVTTYQKDNKTIRNHEEHIRNSLLIHYLQKDEMKEKVKLKEYIFESEVPENYSNHVARGRVDLKVFSRDRFEKNEAYIVIECKRIDGTRTLNKHYITEGVKRFLGNSPLYSSFYRCSAMLGFVVDAIDINKNAKEINNIHKQEINASLIVREISSYPIHDTYPQTYYSEYNTRGKSDLRIYHGFYNVSSIIR